VELYLRPSKGNLFRAKFQFRVLVVPFGEKIGFDYHLQNFEVFSSDPKINYILPIF